jgi:hypothetical protein
MTATDYRALAQQYDEPATARRETPGLRLRTADELAADDTLRGDVRWVVPGFVPRGAVTVPYGVGKSGKSSLAAYVAACVVSGRPCLGRPVVPGAVLWLDLEQHVRLTRRKMLEAGATGHSHAVHIYNGPAPTLADVEAALVETGAVLLVVDSLSRFLRLEDENSAAEVTAALGRLVEVAHRRDVAVLAIHHDRKSGGDHGRGMRGSSAFLAAVDVAVQLKRETDGDVDDGRRRLVCVSRYDEANGTLVVRRVPDAESCQHPSVDDADSIRYTYAVEGSPADVRRARVLAAVGPTEEVDAATLAQRLGVTRPAVVEDLRALHAAGALQRRGSGKKGDAFRYWKGVSTPHSRGVTEKQNQDAGDDGGFPF